MSRSLALYFFVYVSCFSHPIYSRTHLYWCSQTWFKIEWVDFKLSIIDSISYRLNNIKSRLLHTKSMTLCFYVCLFVCLHFEWNLCHTAIIHAFEMQIEIQFSYCDDMHKVKIIRNFGFSSKPSLSFNLFTSRYN